MMATNAVRLLAAIFLLCLFCSLAVCSSDQWSPVASGSGDGGLGLIDPDGGRVFPVLNNPFVLSGVDQACPAERDLQVAIAEVEEDTGDILDGIVDQIECAYLSNC